MGDSQPFVPPLPVHQLEPCSSSPNGAPVHMSNVSRDDPPSGDPELVKDLLKKAHGDSRKVAVWLSEMGLGMGTAMDDLPKHHGGDKDSSAEKLGAPEAFFCPISMHLMRDPVLITTGQTYERRAIVKWLAQGAMTCPATGIALSAPVPLTPNVALRKSIEDWVEKFAPWMLDKNGNIREIEDKDGHLELQSGVGDPTVDTADRELALALQLQDQDSIHRANRSVPPQVIDGAVSNSFPRNRRPSRSSSMRAKVQRSVNLLMLLTLAHIGFFIYTLYLNDWQFESINMNPLIGFSATIINRAGGTDSSQIVDDNEWWRVLTSQFISAGIVHSEATISSLWIFGKFLATRLSFVSLGLLYFASGSVGVLMSANFSTHVVSAGGSAGSFGLLGAMLVELFVHRKQYQMHVVSLVVLLSVSTIHGIIGLTPLVDNWANIGGFVAGIFAASTLMLSSQQVNQGACREIISIFLQIIFGIAVICLLLAGIIGLLTGWKGGAECSWCKKVSCYDTDWWKCETAKILPEDCAFKIQGNLTASIKCPSGHVETIPIPAPTQENLENLCGEICNLRRVAPPPVRLPKIERNQSPDSSPGFSGAGLNTPAAGITSNLE